MVILKHYVRVRRDASFVGKWHPGGVISKRSAETAEENIDRHIEVAQYMKEIRIFK